MKKIILSIMVMLIIMSVVVVSASSNISVFVDGNEVNFPDQRPFIDSNDRTLVPIRFIAEEMGAKVDWDAAKKLVTIERGKTKIELTIGEQRAKVNGSWRHFDTKAVIHNSRTMVPLRFISETLGVRVEWDGEVRVVHIFTKGQSEDEVKKIMEEVKEEEQEQKFSWQPVKPGDFYCYFAKSERFPFMEPARIRYTSVQNLPEPLSEGYTIQEIKVDGTYINVTFTSSYTTAVTMHLLEGNDVSRYRNGDEILVTDHGGGKITARYPIKSLFDTWEWGSNYPSDTDITKVSHFIFVGYEDGYDNLVAVKNPKYRGD